MDIERHFLAAERRALNLRKTLIEVAAEISISQPTLWRARKGKHKRQTTSMKVLRKIEAHLDSLSK